MKKDWSMNGWRARLYLHPPLIIAMFGIGYSQFVRNDGMWLATGLISVVLLATLVYDVIDARGR